MILYEDIRKIANCRFRDSELLYKNGRYNGAIHVCALANELAFKTMICRKLKFKGIPNHSHEFKTIQEIKTHNLEELLKVLSRLDKRITDEIIKNKSTDWNIILDWNPDRRYLPIDEKSQKQWKAEADGLIKSTRKIMRYLWRNL